MSRTIFSPKNILPQKFADTVSAAFPRRHFAAVMLEIAAVEELSGRALLSEWLSEDELARHDSFRPARRRKEWLAGRICAKLSISACRSYKPSPHKAISIQNRSDGRPFCAFSLGRNCPQNLDVSISHSAELAAALASDSLCGIDVQRRRVSLLRVQERYCSPEEEALLRGEFPASAWIDSLNLLWTAKEAVRKTLSYDELPGFLQLDLCTVQHRESGCFVFEFAYTGTKAAVVCTQYKEYAIAACSIEGKIHA